MTQEKKYDVFISYSRKDFDEVNAFIDMLKQCIPTLDIWFDLDGIESGDEFRDKIISAIKRSKYLFFFLSENSDQSVWTRKELQFARGKEIKIIPLLLEGVQLQEMDWFLFEFGGLDCIDITDPKQLEKVVKNLAKWTNKEWIQNKKETLSLNDEQETSISVVTPTPKPTPTSAPTPTSIAVAESVRKEQEEQERIRKEQEERERIAQELKKKNGHEYVDLGLSVKWATCNVGASKPEEYGDYFAWGETTPKSTYDWSTYKYCNGTLDSLTKYNTKSSYGTVDNKTTLELSDDAARANWGGSWRIPTKAEQDELRENCTWKRTTQDGVKGYKVTSKINGKSIFLPAAGSRFGSSLLSVGSYGVYWSSSLDTDIPYYAWSVYFYSDNVSRNGYNRSYGFSVRPVCQ